MNHFIKKTFLISAITFGSFLLVIFIFGSLDPLERDIAHAQPIPRLEELPAAAPVLAKENLTLGVSKALAQEIVANNPEGPTASQSGGQITAPDPEAIVASVIEDGLKNFNPDALREIVIEKNLHVLNTTAPSAQEEYLRNLFDLLEKDLGGYTVDEQHPETSFIGLAQVYSTAEQNLYALPVPAPLLAYHTKMIGIVGSEKNAFMLANSYQADPLQAFLALQLSESFTKEMTDLIDSIKNYAVEHNLNP